MLLILLIATKLKLRYYKKHNIDLYINYMER